MTAIYTIKRIFIIFYNTKFIVIRRHGYLHSSNSLSHGLRNQLFQHRGKDQQTFVQVQPEHAANIRLSNSKTVSLVPDKFQVLGVS